MGFTLPRPASCHSWQCFSFNPLPPVWAIQLIHLISIHDYQGFLVSLNLVACQTTQQILEGQKRYSFVSVLYSQPIQYPRDTVKINFVINHPCLIDKIHLGGGGHAHQRWHRFSSDHILIQSLSVVQNGNALKKIIKFVFIVKYSNIEKHKGESQSAIAMPSNDIAYRY